VTETRFEGPLSRKLEPGATDCKWAGPRRPPAAVRPGEQYPYGIGSGAGLPPAARLLGAAVRAGAVMRFRAISGTREGPPKVTAA
jgi:hypothetical protein